MREAAAQEERERIAAAQEAARVESERKSLLAQQERSRVQAQQEAERLAEQSRLSVPIVQAKAEGVSSRKVWKFDVLDIRELAKHSPGLVRMEPDAKAINLVIADGSRAIPGLRIYETTETKVRAA
jgi:hypothetical protein